MTIAININMITKGNMGNMAPMHMPLSMNRNDAASTPTRNEKNGVRCGNVCAGMRGPMADGEWGMGTILEAVRRERNKREEFTRGGCPRGVGVGEY